MKKKILMSLMAFFLCILQIFNYQLLYECKNCYAYQLSDNSCKGEIRLQDDFYDAINKNWIENTKLKSGCISYGTFEELCGKVNDDIYEIIESINTHKDFYDKNSEELKILNLYNNFLNINKRNEYGIKPIEEYICQIDCIDSLKDLRCLMKSYEFSYFQPLINIGVGADYKDSKKNILYIGRSSLALGNSLYYKDTSPENKLIINEYLKYLTKLHIIYGDDPEEASKSAENFYNIEVELAKEIPTYEEECKDEKRIEKSYNVYTLKELNKLAPNIKFKELLKSFKLDKAEKIIVENPQELKAVNELMVKDNVNKMKSFFKTSVLLNTDNVLTEDFRKASSGLKRVLYGIDVVDLNPGNGIKFVTCQLNEVISRLYVEKFFDKECKYGVECLTHEIIDNFKIRLKNIKWMSRDTQKEALNKLENINVKIGYPDKWNDYKNLKIDSYENGGSLVDNIINIFVTQTKRQFSKINKIVDKDEWNMGACSVNAYYNPLNNEIVFPAGILQAPFYDKNASKEKNLGGIGAVIGHELTHAFDNTGSKFDESGKLYNWWSKSDYEEFKNRSRKIIDYYSNIEIEDGKFVNGYLTVGENISDLGGIACVLDIADKLDNPNLRELFENYAVIWREVSTKELKDYLLNNDPHSPKKVRVNGVLSQFEEFYKTYNVEKGDKMYVSPENRIGIW